MEKIKTFNTDALLTEAVVNAIIELSAFSIKDHGEFHIALSGGSTPKSIYKLMASEEFRSKLPWDKTHIYFGDERCVAEDHPDSNYLMARQAMLNHVPIAQDHVHPIRIDTQDLSASAQLYEQELRTHLPSSNAVAEFDLVLLGIGDDGHTASLFPDTAILNQMDKWVDAVYVEKFAAWRISITYPVINAAKHVFVIAAGEGKSGILKEVLAGGEQDRRYPIQSVQPSGELVWYLDVAAAALLPKTLLEQ